MIHPIHSLAHWLKPGFETCQSLRVKRICGSALSCLRHDTFIAKYGAELGSKSPKHAGSRTLCQTSLISAGKCERQEVQAM